MFMLLNCFEELSLNSILVFSRNYRFYFTHSQNKKNICDDFVNLFLRFATQKVEHFQELLDERKSAFNSLTSK